MDHNDIRHKLSEFIDDAITPGEKAAIEKHLRTCTECSEALRELRKTVEHIHAIKEVESPAWMTQKIMAKVRTEAEKKKSLFRRLFYPLAVKLPIQTVAVLFLAVTAFYIYNSINPAQKYTEEPVGMLAKQEAPADGRMKDKAVREAAPKPDQAPQRPGYKSLDMKYEYERPAPPVPQDRTSTPAAAREAERPIVAGDADSRGTRAAPPQAAAPMMAEQAAPTAGAVQHREAANTAITDDRKAKKASAADREVDALLHVTEYFVKVDLPETMKQKGLRYNTRKFEASLADLGWMRETSAFRVKPCTNRYVVDVDLSTKPSKYLYCYDRSQINLLGVYELKDGAWSEIK